MQVPHAKTPKFQEGFDALETLTIWAWALQGWGRSTGFSPALSEITRVEPSSLHPSPARCLQCLLCRLVLCWAQPLLRSQFSAQRNVFSVPTLADGPHLGWIEKHRNQTAERADCLAMPYRHTSMQTHTRSPHPPHPPPPFAFVVSEPGAGPGAWELSLLLPTDHPLGTCPRWLFMVVLREIGIQ